MHPSRMIGMFLVFVMMTGLIASVHAYGSSYYSKPVMAPSYGNYYPSYTYPSYASNSGYTFVISQPSFPAVSPGISYVQSKHSFSNYMKKHPAPTYKSNGFGSGDDDSFITSKTYQTSSTTLSILGLVSI